MLYYMSMRETQKTTDNQAQGGAMKTTYPTEATQAQIEKLHARLEANHEYFTYTMLEDFSYIVEIHGQDEVEEYQVIDGEWLIACKTNFYFQVFIYLKEFTFCSRGHLITKHASKLVFFHRITFLFCYFCCEFFMAMFIAIRPVAFHPNCGSSTA